LLVGEKTVGRLGGGRPAVGASAGSGDPRTTGSGDPRTTGSGDPRTAEDGKAADGEERYGEIKRMYVRPADRGAGYGKMILDRLAEHAVANGVTLLRLETGIHQQAAIRLYEREGFRRIAPFGPYWDDPVSRCYEKRVGAPLS